VRGAVAIGVATLQLACASTATRLHLAAGEPPLCRPEPALGRVAVLPETAWRSDQKQPDERTELAARALETVFSPSPCLGRVEIRPFASWSSRVEGEHLAALSEEGVTTVAFLRIVELGPTVAVTLSLPLLWYGSSEVEIHLRAVHIPTSRVLLDAHVERSRGGPFQLRPASWSEQELVAALRALVEGESNGSP
jgi:hypothetical protein